MCLLNNRKISALLSLDQLLGKWCNLPPQVCSAPTMLLTSPHFKTYTPMQMGQVYLVLTLHGQCAWKWFLLSQILALCNMTTLHQSDRALYLSTCEIYTVALHGELLHFTEGPICNCWTADQNFSSCVSFTCYYIAVWNLTLWSGWMFFSSDMI